MSIVVLNDNRIATGAWNRELRIPRQLFEMNLTLLLMKPFEFGTLRVMPNCGIAVIPTGYL